jgi:hypothetical protein
MLCWFCLSSANPGTKDKSLTHSCKNGTSRQASQPVDTQQPLLFLRIRQERKEKVPKPKREGNWSIQRQWLDKILGDLITNLLNNLFMHHS